MECLESCWRAQARATAAEARVAAGETYARRGPEEPRFRAGGVPQRAAQHPLTGSLRMMLLLIALLQCQLTRAMVVDVELSMSNGEANWFLLEADYGLAPNATVSFNFLNSQPANDTYVMVLTRDQWNDWTQLDMPSLPTPPGAPQSLSSYLICAWRGRIYDRLQATFQISAPRASRYMIGIFNAQKAAMSLTGQLSLVNPGGEQLRLQDLGMPHLLLWAGFGFLASAAVFGLMIGLASRRGRTWLHLIMGSVLAVKGIVLLLHWWDLLQISASGTDSPVLRVVWQLMDKVQTIMELMMFLLVALGWKVLRAVLDVTEIRFAVGISVISFYLGVFEVACTTRATCSGYQLSRYILHSLCSLVIIVAMNFNLQKIYMMIADAPANMESGKLYRKLHAYQTFRWVFLGFIIAPTAESFLQVSVMPWYALWLPNLVTLLRTLTIYALILIAFRPELPPLRVFELTRDQGSDDEAGEAPEVEVDLVDAEMAE